MIGWMVRNFISKEANVVLKICKTLIKPHIDYSTLGSSVERLKLKKIQRRVTKLIKRVKVYSYKEKLE